MTNPQFPFSNFEPWSFTMDGINFSTLEAAFQALKTFNRDEQLLIANASTPGKAKRLGRQVTLRPDWNEVRTTAMEGLLRAKFKAGTEFARRLVEFQEPLVEWNTWHDTFWGKCTCPRHFGQGENQLGLLLTRIREDLLKGPPPSTITMTYRVVAIENGVEQPDKSVEIGKSTMDTIASFLFDEIDAVVRDIGSGAYGDNPEIAQNDVRELTRICDAFKAMGIAVE
jgi:ribA/ribD-fused uncharacterized protein